MKIIFFLLVFLGFFISAFSATDIELVQKTFTDRLRIGAHEIDDIEEIHFSDEPTTAEELRLLSPYASQVKELYLARCEIDNETLVSLPTFPILSILSLKENFLTNEGLGFISSQTALTSLNLYYNTHITVDGITKLLSLGQTLTFLDVGLTQLRDAGMAIIAAHFVKLEELNVLGCELTDASLISILKLPSLQRVNLGNNKFTQPALQEFLIAAADRNILIQS